MYKSTLFLGSSQAGVGLQLSSNWILRIFIYLIWFYRYAQTVKIVWANGVNVLPMRLKWLGHILNRVCSVVVIK